MHAFTAMAALASVASAAVLPRTTYQGPSESGPFQLEVIAIAGNISAYSGMFINPYHTGAGLNALTADSQQSGAYKYSFNTTNGFINSTLGSSPYFIDLDGATDYAPPKGYSEAALDIGGTNNHFHFTVPDNNLQFGPSYADCIWSICPTEIYTAGVYVPTLLYRRPGSVTNSTCADVKLKAIF